ncbi:MAG: alpha-E domain-containing protein [Pseudoruegeria sp.]
MLSRTAESLYWTSRYIERAETTARLLEVAYRMSLMPNASGGHANEWSSILAAAGVSHDFAETGQEVNAENVTAFMLFDDLNPSSIKNCIRSARENVRSARPALTSEVWETLNGGYLQFGELENGRASDRELLPMCDWTKSQAAAVRGSFETTQLRNEGYDFFNLGYYIERADNTARLLDVKYYVLLPTIHMVGGGVDQYQWSTLMRAVSARRAFHWAYKGDYAPDKIAHFLILNPDTPRSLLHCAEMIDHHLTRLGRTYGTRGLANRQAMTVLSSLVEADIKSIVTDGLHEFLTDFITEIRKLDEAVNRSYLFWGQ